MKILLFFIAFLSTISSVSLMAKSPVILLDIDSDHCHIIFEDAHKISIPKNQVNEIASLLDQSIHTKEILFFSHCLYGGFTPFHNQSLSTLENDLYIEKKVTIIAVKWGTGNPFYKYNYKAAKKSGIWLSEILNRMSPDKIIHLAAHSMGNRLVEGIVESWQGKTFHIRSLVMLSPDIDSDFLITHNDLLRQSVDQVIITHNQYDYALNLSKLILKQDRLGRMPEKANEFQFIDTRHQFFWASHIQWLTNSDLQEEIKAMLKS